MKEKFTTASKNALENTADERGEIAGFWRGLWHGLIAPFAFLMSLFKDDVGVYETHNNGKWYNFGFVLGLSISLGGNKGVQMQTGAGGSSATPLEQRPFPHLWPSSSSHPAAHHDQA